MQISEEEIILKKIDDELINIAKKINLQKFLSPVNLEEECDIFVWKNGNYDPQFVYEFPQEQIISKIIDRLKYIKKEYFDGRKYQNFIAKFLEEKTQEDLNKAELLKSYIKQDRNEISRRNKILFGEFDENLLKKSEHIIQTYKDPDSKVRWKFLNHEEVLNYVKDYIGRKWINDIEIKVVPFANTRFLITFSEKKCNLIFSKNFQTREHELMANMIHEIDVHYTRFANGKKSWWKILTYGTADYIKYEEGLAIHEVWKYKRNFYPAFEQKWIYEKYLLLNYSNWKSFSQISEHIKSIKLMKNDPEFSRTGRAIFNAISRIKQWIQDTGVKKIWNNYIRNKIFLEWFGVVWKWLEDWGNRELLLMWKIKPQDLPYLAW